MTFLRAAMATLACCATLAHPVSAQDLNPEQRAEAMDFALHDATFTLYHEIGHLLVGELGLPVLGKEEDAADALAAILLLNDMQDPDEAFNTLIDSADGWYFSAVESTGNGVDALSYYDEHSLDIQRAYAMVCMMVGAAPEAFGETADIYEFDEERQEDCGGTYQQAFDAWGTLLEPHALNGAPTAEIEVLYEESGDFSDFADYLKNHEVLEKAAEHVRRNYTLPRSLTFRATLCSEANAYYSPSDGEITYCYELAAQMFGLYVENVFAQEAAPDEEAAAEEEQEAEE